MYHKTFENFDNPNLEAFLHNNRQNIPDYTLNNTPYKPYEIPCDYFSIMLIDDTVSDFTDCKARDTGIGIELKLKDNTIVFYYHHYLKGYTFKVKNYQPRTDC